MANTVIAKPVLVLHVALELDRATAEALTDVLAVEHEVMMTPERHEYLQKLREDLFEALAHKGDY